MSLRSPLVSVACRQSKQTPRESDRMMASGNKDIQETPKKISKSSTAANISCCRLCKSVGDISCWKNIYAKGNRALLAAAEDVYGRPLRKDKFLPHLLCRPCERRLKNFISFKTVINESQSSFETVKITICATYLGQEREGT